MFVQPRQRRVWLVVLVLVVVRAVAAAAGAAARGVLGGVPRRRRQASPFISLRSHCASPSSYLIARVRGVVVEAGDLAVVPLTVRRPPQPHARADELDPTPPPPAACPRRSACRCLRLRRRRGGGGRGGGGRGGVGHRGVLGGRRHPLACVRVPRLALRRAPRRLRAGRPPAPPWRAARRRARAGAGRAPPPPPPRPPGPACWSPSRAALGSLRRRARISTSSNLFVRRLSRRRSWRRPTTPPTRTRSSSRRASTAARGSASASPSRRRWAPSC